MENSFFSHLKDLRRFLFFSFLGWTLLSAISYVWYAFIFACFTGSLHRYPVEIWTTSLFEGFLMKLRISMMTGFFLNTPFFLGFLFRFLSPGLYPKEKNRFWMLSAGSALCVLTGIVSTFFIWFPLITRYLVLENEKLARFHVVTVFYLQPTLFFLLQFLGMILLLFHVPFLLILALQWKLCTRQFLYAKSRILLFCLLLLTALFTPDGYSLLLFSVILASMLYGTLAIAALFKWGE